MNFFEFEEKMNLMGVNSLEEETSEYMQNGDIPSFKIYHMSENAYYNERPSKNYGWETGGIFVIDELNESDPPLKIEALPDFMHKLPASMVTFGLDS